MGGRTAGGTCPARMTDHALAVPRSGAVVGASFGKKRHEAILSSAKQVQLYHVRGHARVQCWGFFRAAREGGGREAQSRARPRLIRAPRAQLKDRRCVASWTSPRADFTVRNASAACATWRSPPCAVRTAAVA